MLVANQSAPTKNMINLSGEPLRALVRAEEKPPHLQRFAEPNYWVCGALPGAPEGGLGLPRAGVQFHAECIIISTLVTRLGDPVQ